MIWYTPRLVRSSRCVDCELLNDTLNKINTSCESYKEDMGIDQFSLFKSDLNRHSEAILNWKRHQLRTVNQDRARDYVLEQLDDSSVYLIMDWAMKFLETKYREKQNEWFGKKGLPWHLTVAIRCESILICQMKGSPNFGRKEKCRNVIMSKSNNVENKNGTSAEMLDAFKRQHMIVRNFNALTLSRTFSPSLLFLFSTFSFFGIFMFRHFYFRPKLGLPK